MIDTPSLEVDFGARFHAAVGELTKRQRDIERRIAQLAAGPVEFGGSWDGSTIVIAGTTFSIMRASQRVPGGYQWEVRRLVVGAKQLPSDATQAGSAFAFAANSDTDVSYASFRNSSATLPWSSFYSAGQFVAYSGQTIFVAITSAGAGVNYTFAGTAIQRLATPTQAIAEV